MKTSALILAAGYSSRMGRFKPLLPLGESSVLERVIALFQEAGIGDIKVVTGHRGDETAKVAIKMNAEAIFNPDYDGGMFSSVKAGVQALDSQTRAFFVLPVDIPLVRPETITLLLKTWQKENPTILYPVFKGERGHPPLISTRARNHILSWSGLKGLRGALDKLAAFSLEIETADKYILMDMDHPEDYEKIRSQA